MFIPINLLLKFVVRGLPEVSLSLFVFDDPILSFSSCLYFCEFWLLEILKKNKITPPIPEHAHERGECSGIGSVVDFFRYQGATI